MFDPVTGLPVLPARQGIARPRQSDWSFLASLSRAASDRRLVVAARAPSVDQGTTANQFLGGTMHPAPHLSALATSATSQVPLVAGQTQSPPVATPLVPGALTKSPTPVVAATTTRFFAPGVVVPSAISGRVADLPPVAQSTKGVMALADYHRPVGDTGRGFHWIPTLQSDPAVVDRFVKDAKSMGASWVTFLNDGSNVGQNDYLAQRLVENHIEPVMRIYTDHGSPIQGDVAGMVKHYVAKGVHYFLPYNEPNLPGENPTGSISAGDYADRWMKAAKSIVAGGGLPGIGSLAPSAPTDDVTFLRQTLDAIQQRGGADLLNNGWISVHNYTFNRPVDYQNDSNGFLKFRWYDQVAREKLGRSIPVISTEGGPRLGANLDPKYPAVDVSRRDKLATDSFQYLPGREPYFFAQTQWVLANEAGGGRDPAWSADSLFGADGAPTTLARDLQQSGGQA